MQTYDQRGLSEQEARERLARDGPNELPGRRRRALGRIVLDVMREPMLALLVGAGVVYVALGDIHEALVLLAFACLSIVIAVTQEARTERAIEALRDLTSPRALVIRDGVARRIAGREVVRGDLVQLGEGDRVPADAVVIEGEDLTIDEALLTGESVAVRKAAADRLPEAMERPGGEGRPFVFGGTLVVRGMALGRVLATGARSEIGRIGGSLVGIEPEAPRLYQQTRALVWWMALFGAAASLLCVVLYGLTRGDWLGATLAGIALGMSMLPEEFPVVLAVFMAMGAMRMARARVLTRRAAAIETLGAATVLCADKTGTLTQNRMRIAQLRLPDGRVLRGEGEMALVEEGFRRLAEAAILASAERPHDPMEQAFHALGDGDPGDGLRSRQGAGWTLRRHYPLDPALLAMSQAWAGDGGDGHVIASKGAPEAIGELCRLDAARMSELRAQADAMAAAGLRVLGVAEAHWSDPALPASHRDFAFGLVGLVGLADPLRASVPEAVRQCRAAGIRVAMITGDYPATARAIAREAGIEAGAVMSGEEIAALDDAELARRVGSVSVFARILPEQKLRIVEALKANGEIVAMTGDGVNDAPSLKAAHIGIAMGARGTDVAREAASIVLLDDDFGSIVAAVRHGRRIYDNLRKAMGFIVAVHIPIAALALLPLFAGMPLLLGPVHIALLEMIVDPVCSLAFEAEGEEPDAMRRPPRPPAAPLFPRALVGWAVLQGLVAALAVVAVALHAAGEGLAIELVRARAFHALVLAILGLIAVNRGLGTGRLPFGLERPNRWLAAIVMAVAAMLVAIDRVPQVAALLRLAPLGRGDLVPVMAAWAAMLAGLALLRPLVRRFAPA